MANFWQRALEESRDAALEEQDKEARCNNIILYTVQESEAPLVAERADEDKRFCEQLLFALNVGIANEDIQVLQLGRPLKECQDLSWSCW